MMMDFREPLLLYVFKGSRGGYGETNEENVGLRIGKWAQSIVILLT
jgi:hypothetical protein